MDQVVVAFFGMPGQYEMIIVLVIAVLLFGKRLPEVGRSLGKSITEFKKGVQGIDDEIDEAARPAAKPQAKRPPVEEARDEVVAPKFEPPATEPVDSVATPD